MANRITILGQRLAADVRLLIWRDRSTGVSSVPVRPVIPRMPPGGAPEQITAIITARSGSGSAVRYSAVGEFRTGVSVTLQIPEDRVLNPAIVTIVPAAVGTRCTLARKKDAQGVGVWTLTRAWNEIWSTASCDQGGGAGAGVSGVSTAAEHSRDDRQLTYLTLTSQIAAVTALATTRFGFKIYDFPAGFIVLTDLLLSLKASAPTNTNTLRVSIGTAEATGTGTTLTGTLANIMPQTNLGALTSGGIEKSLFSSILPVGSNGTSAAIDMWVNFCPDSAWTASENITIAQPATAARMLSIAWRNGGLLP